ncbi:hypothetical protein [Nocardia thailandica]|uniref:hypothetical protein n=1 Tax=Nocardia thailandica TaxID=257275 RepID=UPI0002D76247|nr:hypothetical protein [Nocardia thailandica]
MNNLDKSKKWYETVPGKVAVWVAGAVATAVIGSGIDTVAEHLSVDFEKTPAGQSMVLTWEE